MPRDVGAIVSGIGYLLLQLVDRRLGDGLVAGDAFQVALYLLGAVLIFAGCTEVFLNR